MAIANYHLLTGDAKIAADKELGIVPEEVKPEVKKEKKK